MPLRSTVNLLLFRQDDPPSSQELGTLWIDSDAGYPNLFQLTSLSPVTYTAISGGGGGGAPVNAEYVVAAMNGSLTNERLLTNTSQVFWNFATPGQVTATVDAAALAVFTSSLSGVVPGSGGGTTNFLRADGTWASPGGGVPTSRLISTTAPLSGGGDLSADRTLSVATFSSGTSGVVPASGGGTTNFLRADGTWAPAGGSGTFAIFGATVTIPYGVQRGQASVIDAAVGPSSRIMLDWAGTLDTDENDPEMDAVTFTAVPGTGQFTVIAMADKGRIGGTFRLNYTVG